MHFHNVEPRTGAYSGESRSIFETSRPARSSWTTLALLVLFGLLAASPVCAQRYGPGGAIVVPPDRVDDPTMRRSWTELLLEAQEADTESVVVVTGQASVDAEPDRARIFLAVETEGVTAREAGESNAELMTLVTTAVRSAGQAAEGFRVETSAYSLNPRYGPPRQDRAREIVGYTARNMLRVTVDDVEVVGALIDAALDAGANRVSSLLFEVRDPQPYRLEALREAIRTAREEAEVMAESLGMVLGDPLEVEGGADAPYPRPLFEAGMERAFGVADAAPTPIEAGLQTISARVTIRFRLDPTP